MGLFIHLSCKYFLSTYYVSAIVLDTQSTSVKKIQLASAYMELTVYCRDSHRCKISVPATNVLKGKGKFKWELTIGVPDLESKDKRFSLGSDM